MASTMSKPAKVVKKAAPKRMVAKAAKPHKAAPKSQVSKDAKPKLLSGGNPQIAKAYGDAPVQAYIAAMPGWKSEAWRRLDALIARTVPGVHKAVKWNSPLYGIEGQGWFLGVHCFTKYIKVAFFRGASLRPVPPGASKQKDVRYLDIHEDDQIDEAQFAAWVKQASQLPGEKMWAGSRPWRRADATPSGLIGKRMKRVLITGMSGTWKSAVVQELAVRGYQAYDLDTPEWSEWIAADSSDALTPAEGRDWVWREGRVRALLSKPEDGTLFISGCAENMARLSPLIDTVILLSAPLETIMERLAARSPGNYGHVADERRKVAELISTVEPLLRKSADHEIDTRRPTRARSMKSFE